jgi:DNA-binding NarL/FixJ family response regulator
MFTQMGADGFARRARRELTATGEKVTTRPPARAASALTTQETQIAILVRDGYTNNEIAGQLFLSPRTVEWHLGHIFTKLGIASRRSLRVLTLD